MRIEETFELGLPREQVYAAVNNVGEIGYCIAGVKQVRVLNDEESEWKLEVRVGFMARTIDLRGRITERRPPAYLAFEGQGQDVRVSGFLELAPANGDRTRCHVVVDAEITGPFATVVNLMARSQHEQLIRQTIHNLRQRLEGKA